MAKKKAEAQPNKEVSVHDVMNLLSIQENLEHVQKKYKISGSTTDIEARKGTAISTGLLMYDILLGGGVFPGGWYTLFGSEGTAKSSSLMTLAVSFFDSGVPLIFYQDAEGCVTPDTLIKIGNTEKSIKDILLAKITIEEYKRLLSSNKSGVIVIDDLYVSQFQHIDPMKAVVYYRGHYPITKITLENGLTLSGYHHRVLTADLNVGDTPGLIAQLEYCYLEDLSIGDVVQLGDGDTSDVLYIETFDSEPVLDISILSSEGEYPHSIITNGIVTHNSTSPDYIEAIARNLSSKNINCRTLFGVKDEKGNYVIKPRMTLTNDNSLEGFYKSMSTLLKGLPDKVYIDGEWWLLFENTKQNISRFKGKSNTKIGNTYGKIAIPSLDGGTAQALIMLDSLPLLVTDNDDTEDGDNSIATDARGHSKHLKKLRGKLKRKHATVLAINQLRDAIPINGRPGIPYEPCGNAVKHAADVRIRHASRAIPHASGSQEQEDTVLFRKGEDTYRYIAMNGTKNKFGTPYLETWFRLWVKDPKGIGHGFCPVYDTFTYLKTTGQADGSPLSKRINIRIGDVEISKISWFTFKSLILWYGNKNFKKELNDLCESLGLKKIPDIRGMCFKQMKSGKGLELYFQHLHGLDEDEEEEVDLESMSVNELIKEAVAWKLGKKKDLQKMKQDDLIALIQSAYDEEESEEDEE